LHFRQKKTIFLLNRTINTSQEAKGPVIHENMHFVTFLSEKKFWRTQNSPQWKWGNGVDMPFTYDICKKNLYLLHKPSYSQFCLEFSCHGNGCQSGENV